MTKSRNAQGTLTVKRKPVTRSSDASPEASTPSSPPPPPPSASETVMPPAKISKPKKTRKPSSTPRLTDREKTANNINNAVTVFDMLKKNSNPSSSVYSTSKQPDELSSLDKHIARLSDMIEMLGEGADRSKLIATYTELIQKRSQLVEKKVDQEVEQYREFNRVLAAKTEKAKGAELGALASLWGNTINGVGTEFAGAGSGTNGVYATRCNAPALPFDMNEINAIDVDEDSTDSEDNFRRSPIKPERKQAVKNSLGANMIAEIDETEL